MGSPWQWINQSLNQRSQHLYYLEQNPPHLLLPYSEARNSQYLLNNPRRPCLEEHKLLYLETKVQLNRCLVDHQNPLGLCLAMLPQLVAFLEQVLSPVCSKLQLYLARLKTKKSQMERRKIKVQSLRQLTQTLTKSSSRQLSGKLFRKTHTPSRLKRRYLSLRSWNLFLRLRKMRRVSCCRKSQKILVTERKPSSSLKRKGIISTWHFSGLRRADHCSLESF